MSHVITAGLRPPERSFLFHWCLKVANGTTAPADVPAMAGVDIVWDHGTKAKSRQAAKEMADAFGLVGVAAHPSNHNGGTAIDMKLELSGNSNNKLTYTLGTKSVTRTIKTDGEAKVGESSKGKSISSIGSRQLSKAGADFGVKPRSTTTSCTGRRAATEFCTWLRTRSTSEPSPMRGSSSTRINGIS